jgi:Co/Zn/Cd efflux system component
MHIHTLDVCRHADNLRYSFGTGKVGVLGGFASAVALYTAANLDLHLAPEDQSSG